MFDISVFSANLRAARKRKKLSQRQLAEQLFLSTQAVSKWELGISQPDMTRLYQLSQVLQVSTDSLLGVTPGGTPALIGIDAGGTKTEFVLIATDGSLLDRLLLRGVNPNTCGIQTACEVFRQGIDALMQKSCRVLGIYIGGAGMASGGNGVAVEAALRQYYPTLALRCETDICNILACAETPDNAIAAICGTGSVVYATINGKLRRFGGGGWRLETAGSGYDLGRQALLAALEHRDGTGPATALTEPVEQMLGGKVWDSIDKIYAADAAFAASFTPLVLDAWQKNDPVATDIVHTNAGRLAQLINTAAASSPEATQVLLGGSLLTKSAPFCAQVTKQLDPLLHADILTKPLVWGACLQCARLLNLPAPDEALFTQTYQED